MKRTEILTRERSEEEKARRHREGDKGAKFSGGKDSWHLRLEVGDENIGNAITSVQKDYLLMEVYGNGDGEHKA